MTTAAPASTAPLPVARSLARNSSAQVAGRLFLSVARLGAAVIVVRLSGSTAFGQYVLLLGLVAIFEWLVDFGQADMAVRQACMDPATAPRTFAALARLKRLWSPALAAALPLVALAMRYPGAIVAGAAVGGVSVLTYGWLQPARAALKAGMRSDIDVAAEVAGVLVMLPAIALAALLDGSPPALMAAYTLSRLIHAGIIRVRAPLPAHADTPGAQEVRALLHAAIPLGLTGLVVALYDGLAPIMLSKLMSFEDVARYGAASRFALPVLTVVQAMTGAFFPVIARRSGDPSAMGAAQRAALWLALMIAGGLAAGLHGGADWLLGLVGGAPAAAGDILRWMTWLVIARAMTTAMAPLVVIGGQQHRGLWLTLASLAAQAAAIPLLVPAFGLRGVVIGYLAIECVLGVGPVSWLAIRATGVRIDWSVPIRLAGAALLAGVAIDRLPIAGSIVGGVAAGLLFLLLGLLSGVLSPARLREVMGMMREKGAEA